MNSKTFYSVFYSWIVILFIMILGSLFLSLLIKFTNYQEDSFSTISLTISYSALFIGGIVAGVRNKEKGWLAGGLTGIGFTVVVFLLQFLGYNKGFSFEQNLIHLGFIFLATLGGMIGVNFFSNKKK